MFSNKKRVTSKQAAQTVTETPLKASTSNSNSNPTTTSANANGPKVKTIQRVVTVKAPVARPVLPSNERRPIMPLKSKAKRRPDSALLPKSSSNGATTNKRRRVDKSETPSSYRVTQSEEEDDDDDVGSGSNVGDGEGEKDVVCERDVSTDLDGRVECTSSLKVVQTSKAQYIKWFTFPGSNGEEEDPHRITLEMPNEGAQEVYSLMVPVQSDEYNPIVDLINTIRTVIDQYLTREQASVMFGYSSDAFAFLANATLSRSATPSSAREETPAAASSQPPLMRSLEKARVKKDGPAFVAAVNRFNEGLRSLKESGSIRENIKAMKGVRNKLWMHIVNQCYERIVGPDIEQLKAYTAFSDNVYGELEAKFVGEICSQTNTMPSSVFVDLGSGVGNCVIEAAISTGAESWGFENMPAASSLARAQIEEASSRCRLWGISSGRMRVEECDFCESPLVPQILRRADVVLVNNEVFTASLNEKLSLMFLEMKSGAKIVSLKAFASGFTLSAYTRDSPLAILDQGQPKHYGRKAVSWKDQGGTYFIATIDRSKVEEFDRKSRQAPTTTVQDPAPTVAKVETATVSTDAT